MYCFVQERISDCQHNIIQMEATKDETENFELEGLMSQVSTLEESKYLIEKLYNAMIAQSIAQVQTEINVDTLDAKVHQVRNYC